MPIVELQSQDAGDILARGDREKLNTMQSIGGHEEGLRDLCRRVNFNLKAPQACSVGRDPHQGNIESGDDAAPNDDLGEEAPRH